MKAQMKAAVTSLVVIAFCLAAVGGVTYSWFSDSEESTVEVETSRIDISSGFTEARVVSGPSQFKVEENPISSSVSSLSISNLAANCRVDLTLTTAHGSNNNTTTNCKTVAHLESLTNKSNAGLTQNDLNNIFIGGMSLYALGVTTDSISREFVVFPTQTFDSAQEKLEQKTILYTPETYSYDDKTSGDNAETKKFKIVFKTTAYQDDYTDSSMLRFESTDTEQKTGKATITSDSRIVFADTLGSFRNVKASFGTVEDGTQIQIIDATANDKKAITVKGIGDDDMVTMSLAFVDNTSDVKATDYKVTCGDTQATILAAIDSTSDDNHFITLTFTINGIDDEDKSVTYQLSA